MDQITQNHTAPFSSLTVGNTAEVISKTKGLLKTLDLCNTNAAVRYLKVYDELAPTNASTPKLRICVPPAGAARFLDFGEGVKFNTAIAIRATTEQADNGTTSPTATEFVVNATFVAG